MTDFCAPLDQQGKRWMITFDDADRRPALYEDEEVALAAFDRAETMGWNCYLWTLVPRVTP